MTQVIDTPHGCFKIHGPSNYAWIKQQLLDAQRYQYVRDKIDCVDYPRKWAIYLDDPGVELSTEKVFDAAIDKAMTV